MLQTDHHLSRFGGGGEGDICTSNKVFIIGNIAALIYTDVNGSGEKENLPTYSSEREVLA